MFVKYSLAKLGGKEIKELVKRSKGKFKKKGVKDIGQR